MDDERGLNNDCHVTALEPSAVALREQVRAALERYFHRLNGHTVTDLHDLVMAEVEKPLLETVLRHVGHNQTKAADILGISRSTLRKKMQQYGIQ